MALEEDTEEVSWDEQRILGSPLMMGSFRKNLQRMVHLHTSCCRRRSIANHTVHRSSYPIYKEWVL